MLHFWVVCLEYLLELEPLDLMLYVTLNTEVPWMTLVFLYGHPVDIVKIAELAGWSLPDYLTIELKWAFVQVTLWRREDTPFSFTHLLMSSFT